MLKNCSTSIKINFLWHEQSSQCKTMRDSSVSYASAAAKVDMLENVFSFETSSNLIIIKLTVMFNPSKYAFHEPS
ncbi:hypothetical protein PRUPE_1G567700 [Prunus persica]|uniref:Uncharacterized protein n=1 Tax=Prunus persica TaxID=3760 RepID=A0A251RJ81_PRUPE|nr:hypothetical protein PRUPE_1G567700 [Prunus persica]